MTNEELLTKIKVEVERLKAENRGIKCKENSAYCEGYDDAFYDLIPFLSTLESEKPMILDKEFEMEMDNYVGENELVNCSEIVPIARHFAKWGAEQFAKIVRGNLPEIGNNAQSQFERLYFEITGTKMYGGYND